MLETFYPCSTSQRTHHIKDVVARFEGAEFPRAYADSLYDQRDGTLLGIGISYGKRYPFPFFFKTKNYKISGTAGTRY